MKLSGWIRLGIVVSIFWALMISGWAAYESYVGAPFGEFVFVNFAPQGAPIDTDKGRVTPVTSSINTGLFLKILLIPLIATWIIIAVTVLAARWVITGFRR